jgi:hypothetical protein
MPYASPAQSRFIHAKAGEGVSWAKKFVNDSKGTKVPPKFSYIPKSKQQAMRPLGTVIPGNSKRGKRIRQAHKLGPRIKPWLGGGDTGA